MTRAAGARVVLTTAPSIAPGDPAWVRDEHVAAWNELVHRAAAAHADVTVVDVAAIVARLEAESGGSRRPDGAHLDDAAVLEVGRRVGAVLLAEG